MEQNTKSALSVTSEMIGTLRAIAIDSLARMYRPAEKIFAFRLKKNGQAEVLQGVSRRYTAIALIGLSGENEHTIAKVLCNHSPEEVCGNLIKDIEVTCDLGELSLTTWAARILKHPNVHKTIDLLKRFGQDKKQYSTIELSWALSALTNDSNADSDETLAKEFAQATMDSFNRESGFFFPGAVRKGLRSLCSH